MNRVTGGFVIAVMDAAELPVPPGGVRPGHLDLVTSGRVVLGDIAATAVDLSLRGWLELESTGGEDGGWVLAAAEPPPDGQDPLEYERVLLEWLARPGYPASFASLASDLSAGLAKVREELVRDAVRNGWLCRLHHHEPTKVNICIYASLSGGVFLMSRFFQISPAHQSHGGCTAVCPVAAPSLLMARLVGSLATKIGNGRSWLSA